MNNNLIDNLLEKSQESFLVSIELFNKPTINYRAEGFTYFICNAWELLLKAYMIKTKGNSSIYYPNKENRTLSLSECVKKVFTNENDPVRKNLEIIIELRNTSTHFIIKEMEQLFTAFFQSCVLNYSQKLLSFFNIDITNKINGSFMTLITNVLDFKETDLLGKYGKNIVDKYLKMKKESELILEGNRNEKLAIDININAKIVKDEEKAEFTFRIAKDGENPIVLIKEPKDINIQYPFNQNKAISKINDLLKKRGISIKLNAYQYQQLCKYYKLYDNLEFCYPVLIDKNPRKLFSMNTVNFIVSNIETNPNIIKIAISENKK